MRMMLVCERVCLCSAPKGPHLFGTGKILERRARTQTGEIVQIHPQPNARLSSQMRRFIPKLALPRLSPRNLAEVVENPMLDISTVRRRVEIHASVSSDEVHVPEEPLVLCSCDILPPIIRHRPRLVDVCKPKLALVYFRPMRCRSP
eukprot:CAMPEP_0181228854 /NCGR_PEP_ID=MMETSP1096-20121128/33574_1 /TAXON_ID=156174 ORGANISM="Chrysochromulina ericina, Strain CCMP281" /NCGR_SAMPLE_ID=MMETSP1096 /ASSEMBLY_ACC=CAM_ASM_000453 /LENGTH=146 /DNA_ID=CAMNT_0023322415 /DNA_START=306 /DNA_END=746 /DNA_ORIENTATION=+